MNNVISQETDTFDEVNKVVNRIIENQRLIEGKVCQLATVNDAYNAEVEKYNKGIVSSKKSTKKSVKKKGTATVKILMSLVLVLLLAVTAFGEFQQINSYNVANEDTLEIILRERLGRTGDTFTFSNGLTIDNATNNAMEWNENDEALIWTFATDAVTLSTDTSVVFSFGTMIPNLDGLDVDSYVYFNPIAAPPATTEGYVWMDDANNVLTYYNGSAWVALTTGTGDNTLDDAYDQPTAGAGRTITADTGAVALTNTDDDTAFLLTLNAAPGSGSALGGIEVTVGTNSTENGIEFENTGSGDDIQGTGDTWAVDKAGLGTFTGITNTGATVNLNASSNFATNINTGSSTGALTLGGGSGTIAVDSSDWDISTTGAMTNIASIAMDPAPSNITLTSNSAADDFTVALAGSTDSSLILSSTGIGADALRILTTAGGIDIITTGAAAGEDIDITTNASINLTSTESATDSIVISSSVGGIQILAAGAAATEDILLTATGSSVIVTATENQSNAITLNASDAAGGIDVDAGTGGIAVDITGAGDFRLDSSGGKVILIGAEAAATAVTIDAENAAGGIDMDYGTGGMVLTGTGVAANFTIDVDALSFDFTDSSNITVTSSEAGEDLTISQIGSNDSSIIITSAGQGINAIELTTSDAAGDIDINAGDAITINAGDIVITTDDAAANQFKVDATGAVAGNAIVLETSDGGLQINIDGATAGDIDIDAVDDMTVDVNSVIFTVIDPAVNAFKVDATGAGIAGNAIVLETTEGGIQLLSDGDTEGDITIDAEDTITIVSTDNAASGIYLHLNGGTSETLKIHSDLGTGNASIDLLSDAGGMTFTANGANATGQIIISSALVLDGATTAFSGADATPDVSGHTLFITGGADTYTNFDCGSGTCDVGQIVIVFSGHGATFDTTSTNLSGSSSDLVTASGDITMWIFDGTNWRLLQFTDVSADNSGGV